MREKLTEWLKFPALMVKRRAREEPTHALPPTHIAHSVLASIANAAGPIAVVSGEAPQHHPAMPRECGLCGAAEGEKKLLNCSACHSALYCGAACQKGGWKSHKKVGFSSVRFGVAKHAQLTTRGQRRHSRAKRVPDPKPCACVSGDRYAPA
jgi:hypothetical protein